MHSTMLKDFFSLNTVGGLREYLINSAEECADIKTLQRYASTWGLMELDDDVPFLPQRFLSEDLSAALYADCPSIFLGGNSWAKAYTLNPISFRDRVESFFLNLKSIREDNPDAEIYLILVPEKDYIINKMFVRDSYVDHFDIVISQLRERLAEIDVQMCFDEYVGPLASYQVIQDYIYPDSHLPTANYIQKFSRFLTSVGVDWEKIKFRLKVEKDMEFCDLNDRLVGLPENPVTFYTPKFIDEDVELVGGDESFASPLGNTKQILKNNNWVDARRLLILGDSHCSIYSKKKLTYLCANTFSDVEFQWNPCGVRSAVGSTKHSIILLEVTQRFIFTV